MGFTNIQAFTKQEEAKAMVEMHLGMGHAVAVCGPTDAARLIDETGAGIFWSKDPKNKIIIVIASPDGVDPVKLPQI